MLRIRIKFRFGFGYKIVLLDPNPDICPNLDRDSSLSHIVTSNFENCRNQCCGSRMIYSLSGSSYEFFMSRIQPILFKHGCHFLFHTTVQYNQSRIRRPKIRNNFFLPCSLIFCRIQGKVPDPCGSGSTTLLKILLSVSPFFLSFLLSKLLEKDLNWIRIHNTAFLEI